MEATAFGARAIVDRFIAEGIAIEQVIAMGGIAKKNPFVMQVTADVLKMPIKVVRSEQACALGAAIFAAAAAGLYPSVYEAQARMASDFSETYFPNGEMAGVYDRLYEKYLLLGRFMEDQFLMLADLKRRVLEANLELQRAKLVICTWGMSAGSTGKRA